jgi:hypothetical protein
MLRGSASFCNRWSVAALLVTVAAIVALAQLGDASSTPAGPLMAASERGPWQVSSVEELLDALQQVPARGGTIQLATGDYVLDQTIEVRAKSFLNIVGAGWDTRIIRRGEGDAVKLIDSSFGSIRNLLLQGDEAATSGSAIRYQGHCSSCVIDFCRIVNFPESGVCYEGDRRNPMSSNTVRDCHFIGNLGDQLASAHNNDFYIVGNQFGTHRGHPRSGCDLVHSSAGTYSMNYHWGNQVALRMGPSANFNRVENNRLEESRESALLLGAGAEGEWNMFNIISGNTFHTNSQSQSGAFPAVLARNSHEITFCGNQVFSWDAQRLRHKHSLVIGENCDRWIVKDNILRHNTDEAIVYEAATHMVVKDNLVE